MRLIVLLTCLFYSSANVHQLTNETFENALKVGFVFVNFIQDECDKCKNASLIMKNMSKQEGVYIAEMNCSLYSCDVQKFPTLKFFTKDLSSEYTGELKLDDVVQFVNTEVSKKWYDVHIKTEKDVEKFVFSDNEPKVITNIQNPNLKIYIPSLQYGFSNNNLFPNNTIRVYKHKANVARFKEYDENTMISIIEFVLGNTINHWNFIGTSSLSRAFLYSDQHVLLFDYNNKTMNKLKPVAQKYSPQYIFVMVTPNDTEITSMFNIKTYPSLVLVTKSKSQRLKQYPLNGLIDNESVQNHIQQYIRRSLKPMVISEPTPVQQDSIAFKVTGNTIQDVIKHKNLFLMTYISNCEYCEETQLIMNKLHLKFKGENLIIGTYNLEHNDHHLVRTDNMLTLLLYTTDSQTPIEYHGDIDEDTITRFLDEYGFSVRSEL